MTEWKEIGVQQTREKVDSSTAEIIDIRDSGSYEAAHIPGAIQLSDKTVEGFMATADKEKPLIVYCYHGVSSQGAAAFFAEQGFKEVYSMAGGFEAWRYTQPTEP